MNIVTVRINGVEYNLKGEEREEYLHRVASYVDKKVKNIIDVNGKLSTASASVLTAINAVDDMLKKDDEVQQLLNKVKELEKKQIKLLGDIQNLNENITELQKDNKGLSAKNENLNLKSSGDDYDKILKERDILEETSKKYLRENKKLKAEQKEYKFQSQSSKYKMIDLQHKFIETQIELVKLKKDKNPMIKMDTLQK